MQFRPRAKRRLRRPIELRGRLRKSLSVFNLAKQERKGRDRFAALFHFVLGLSAGRREPRPYNGTLSLIFWSHSFRRRLRGLCRRLAGGRRKAGHGGESSGGGRDRGTPRRASGTGHENPSLSRDALRSGRAERRGPSTTIHRNTVRCPRPSLELQVSESV